MYVAILTPCLCGFCSAVEQDPAGRWTRHLQRVDRQLAPWNIPGYLGKLAALREDLRKQSQLTNTSWWHRPPNHNWLWKLWKLHISLEAAICVPFMFRSPFFLHTLGPLFPKEITNLDSSENMTEEHCSVVFLLSSFFSLHHFSRFCRCLSLSAIEQRFYSWYTAAETLFMQPSMCCSVRCLHSSLLPHPSQSLGAVKPLLLSQSGQGRPFYLSPRVDLFRPQFCRLLPIFVSI